MAAAWHGITSAYAHAYMILRIIDGLLFGVKNTLPNHFNLGPRAVVAVRSLKDRGGRFSELANVLLVQDLQSVTRALFALEICSLFGLFALGCSTVYS